MVVNSGYSIIIEGGTGALIEEVSRLWWVHLGTTAGYEGMTGDFFGLDSVETWRAGISQVRMGVARNVFQSGRSKVRNSPQEFGKREGAQEKSLIYLCFLQEKMY